MDDVEALARMTLDLIRMIRDVGEIQRAYREVRLRLGLQAAANLRLHLRARMPRRDLKQFIRVLSQEVREVDRARQAPPDPLAAAHREHMIEFAHAIGVFDTADAVLNDAHYANATNERRKCKPHMTCNKTLKTRCGRLRMFVPCAVGRK